MKRVELVSGVSFETHMSREAACLQIRRQWNQHTKASTDDAIMPETVGFGIAEVCSHNLFAARRK